MTASYLKTDIYTSGDEAANHTINALPQHLQAYARSWLAHQKNGAAMPTLKDFDISYGDAQWARIKLAALL